jgi:hypothetical protein
LPSVWLLKCVCRSSSGWPSLTFRRRKPFSIIQISDFLLRGKRRWSGTRTREVGKVSRPQAPHGTWLRYVCRPWSEISTFLHCRHKRPSSGKHLSNLVSCSFAPGCNFGLLVKTSKKDFGLYWLLGCLGTAKMERKAF